MHRPRGCGRDGDDDGEVDHRALASTGEIEIGGEDPALSQKI
jgi:hypothetical protein